MFVCECSSCFWENKRSPALCSKVSLGNGCLCGTGRILGGPEDGPDGAWFHKRIKTQTWAICLVVLKAEPSKELEIMTTKPHNLWSWTLIRSAVSQPNVSLFCFLGVFFAFLHLGAFVSGVLAYVCGTSGSVECTSSRGCICPLYPSQSGVTSDSPEGLLVCPFLKPEPVNAPRFE